MSLGEFYLKKGYNRIETMPRSYNSFSSINTKIDAGSMIGMSVSSDLVNFMYSDEESKTDPTDYFLAANSKLNKLNGRFYFNVLVDVQFYMNKISLEIHDPKLNKGKFYVSADFGYKSKVNKYIQLGGYFREYFV